VQTLKLIPTEETFVGLDEAIKAFVLVKITGIEISNAVHTAQTIAHFQNKLVCIGHIERV
jgi:hypothetical protein